MVVDTDKTIIRLIKIKSGQGVQLRFPDDNSNAEFIDKCCMCGHTCKTKIHFDYNGRTMDVVWEKMDGVN